MTEPRAKALVAATLASFGLAVLHLAIIPIGARAYGYFLAGDDMVRLAEQGSPVPAIVTFVVAVFFALFGLYGLSSLRLFHELPATRIVIVVIACVYTLRGALIVPEGVMVAHLDYPARALAFSAVSLAIGIGHFVGVYQQWMFIPHADAPGKTREV